MYRDNQYLIAGFKLASRSYSDASILTHEMIARKDGLSGTNYITGLVDRLEKKPAIRKTA